MTTSPDPLRTLLQDWAEQEAQGQITPLTPALLCCKARLAREDARRARLLRLRALLLVPPALLVGLGVVSGFGHAGIVIQAILTLNPPALSTLLTYAVLLSLAGPVLAID